MSLKTYIGARYVPIFLGAWDKTKAYEALSVVTYNGFSYTSKRSVNSGTEITNTDYWAESGNFNAQVENLLNDVNDINDHLFKRFDTLSDIKNVKPNDICVTLGYHNINDGGNCTYVINSSEGHKIAENIYAKPLISEVANVKQFGAYGDNNHIDTDAFSNAVNFALDNNIPLYIPAGTYLLNKTIEIATIGSKSMPTILGAGVNLTTITSTEKYAFKILHTNQVGTIYHNTITGISFYKCGINVQDYQGIDINECRFDDCPEAGVMLTNHIGWTEFIVANNCEFRNCATWFGCNTDSTTDYSLHGCGFNNCTGGLTSSQHVWNLPAFAKLYNSPLTVTVFTDNSTLINKAEAPAGTLQTTTTYGCISIEGSCTISNNNTAHYHAGQIIAANPYSMGNTRIVSQLFDNVNGVIKAFEFGRKVTKTAKNNDTLITLDDNYYKLSIHISAPNLEAHFVCDYYRQASTGIGYINKTKLENFNANNVDIDIDTVNTQNIILKGEDDTVYQTATTIIVGGESTAQQM